MVRCEPLPLRSVGDTAVLPSPLWIVWGNVGIGRPVEVQTAYRETTIHSAVNASCCTG